MPLHTHYDELKVSRNAPPEVIRAAYRVLAQRYHPDRNPTPDAARIMTLINEAFAVLSDPERRAEHDAWIDAQLSKDELDEALAGGRRQKASQNAPPPGAASDPPAPPPPPPAPPPTSGLGAPGTDLGVWVVVVGVLIALLWSGAALYRTDSPGQPASYNTARVNAVARPSSDNPLHLICEARDIKDSTCSKAKGYPDSRACDVRLEGPSIEGHFLSPDSTILLVSYRSDCEPHATNWGGSLLFEKRGASTVFKGYHRGIVVSDCTSIVGPGRERLLCTSGGMGQGHMSTHVTEIVFTQNADNKLEISSDHVISAMDNSGAYGANRVECNSISKLFVLASPKPGPAPNTVLFRARYANADLIRKACAPDSTLPKGALEPAPSGEAYIDEGEILERWFIMDLATRKITEAPRPESVLLPAQADKVVEKSAENVAGAPGQYTTNGDGQRVEARAPNCRGAQHTQLTEWGGDFYSAWCVDRESMTRRMNASGSITLTGVYEKVVDKVIFWREAQNRPCMRGQVNFVDMFNALHAFYEHHPHLLYRDLDEGLSLFVTQPESCK